MNYISIYGTLNVIERNGKRGAFNVAELVTQIGTFNIKHAVLDQFFPGSYSGQFTITKIYSKPNQWNGQVFINLHADLNWAELQIMAESESPEHNKTLEVQGLMQQDMEDNPQYEETQDDDYPNQDNNYNGSAAETIEDVKGLAHRNAPEIKLGESILADRLELSAAKEILKQYHYRYNPALQVWHRNYGR